MLNFLLLLIINCLWIWGVVFIFSKGQILGSLGDEIRKLPKWLSKPMIGCPPCLASVHGALFFLFYYDFTHLALLPIFCVCLTGINFIIREFIYDVG